MEEVFVREGLICLLTVRGRTIRSTSEHPFFVDGKGWTPLNRIAAGERIGTEAGEWVTVDAVDETGEWETVYNFRVADHHTYFVGCDEWGFSVWAHNADYEIAYDATGKRPGWVLNVDGTPMNGPAHAGNVKITFS